MAKAGYLATTGANVALTAGTAKSTLGVLAPSTFGGDLVAVRVGLDTATSLLVELCSCTFATNGPGTNSTSVTMQQIYGRSVTTGFTAARAWTTEPTTITVLEEWLFTSGATAVYDVPLGDTYDCAVSTGFVLRLTAVGAANARASMKMERC
jgi:hypothetical protein